MKKYIYSLLLFFTIIYSNAQTYKYFLYESDKEQYFKMHAGSYKTMHYVKMDRNDILFNTLFDIADDSKKLIIPEDGYYEVEGLMQFNLNTGNVKGSRAGINFGFVAIANNTESFFAATRISFDDKNQNTFMEIPIHPTIVYLAKDTVIAPAINAGLLDKPILNAQIVCEKKHDGCVSFKWSIKQISNEQSAQKYY